MELSSIIILAVLCIIAFLIVYAYIKARKEDERREREFEEFCQRLCTNKEEKYNFEILPNGDFKIETRNAEGNNDKYRGDNE